MASSLFNSIKGIELGNVEMDGIAGSGGLADQDSQDGQDG
jgi:hypothetical protein